MKGGRKMNRFYEKHKTAAVMIALVLTALGLGIGGCNSARPVTEEGGKAVIQTQEARRNGDASDAAGADAALPEYVETPAAEAAFGGVPILPKTGKGISDFIPSGFTLLDSVTLDFNSDGTEDHVGVLEYDSDAGTDGGQTQDWIRILFAVASEGPQQYRLDFQNENLIRTRDEGGVFGDPYQPLTAEGTSFTTNSFGGSAWKWSESYTYTYDNGIWYLTASEKIYGYGSYITQRDVNDYMSGTGTRNRRSSEPEDMDRHMEAEGEIDSVYDLSYEVSLDKPVTLEQAGMRWGIAPERQEEWPVESVKIADGVDIGQEEVDRLCENLQPTFYYNDENYRLFTFSDQTGEKHYLAQYGRKDRTLAVLAQECADIDEVILYRGRVYYTTELIETISYKENEGTPVRSEEQIGMSLYSIGQNGADRREVFSYRLPESSAGIMEGRPSYISFVTEINGGEIISEVCISGRPHQFYRMNLDGSGLKLIGTTP